MPKYRVGLQKEFSEIFEGVWVPESKRVKRGSAATEQNQHQQKGQIEEIMRAMKCTKDFQCYKSGFTKLCNAKLIADTGLVECSPENQQACEFRTFFMDRNFCKCQLRRYIAKNLHK